MNVGTIAASAELKEAEGAVGINSLVGSPQVDSERYREGRLVFQFFSQD